MSGKRRGGREEALELLPSLVSERLAQGVVVIGEVCLRHPELIADGGVAEVQHVELGDFDGSDPTKHLER